MTSSKNCLHCRHCSIVPLGTGDVIACHEEPGVIDNRFSIPVKDAESYYCENYESVSLRKFILTRPQLDTLYNTLATAINSDRRFDTYELGIDTEDSEAYVAGCVCVTITRTGTDGLVLVADNLLYPIFCYIVRGNISPPPCPWATDKLKSLPTDFVQVSAI